MNPTNRVRLLFQFNQFIHSPWHVCRRRAKRIRVQSRRRRSCRESFCSSPNHRPHWIISSIRRAHLATPTRLFSPPVCRPMHFSYEHRRSRMHHASRCISPFRFAPFSNANRLPFRQLYSFRGSCDPGILWSEVDVKSDRESMVFDLISVRW